MFRDVEQQTTERKGEAQYSQQGRPAIIEVIGPQNMKAFQILDKKVGRPRLLSAKTVINTIAKAAKGYLSNMQQQGINGLEE